MLTGKKILLGVAGSIAAYKSAFLVRLLVKAGAEVRVVMTHAATEFIAPLTLATLSKHEVVSDFTADKDAGTWNNHVELGLWADVMVVAPATANTLAKMASGRADNLLLAVYLSARCPVLFAPAMDLDMYRHPSTAANLATLAEFGNKLIKPGTGELASGLEGEGRMAEPEEIVEALAAHFSANQPLHGKHVLITAGPTYEPIDPVRFIGNRSSGKMGFALAEEAARLGATVRLIAGPTSLQTQASSISRTNVETASDMYEAVHAVFPEADVVIMAAAVADYTPETVADSKIKKKSDELSLRLVKTRDVLKSLGEARAPHQFLVGFALETDNELENARGKLERKKLDLLVLNSLRDAGAGFGVDTNKIHILGPDNKMTSFELKSKQDVARDIFAEILKNYDA